MIENPTAIKVDDLWNFYCLFLEILGDPFLITNDSRISKRTRLIAILTIRIDKAVIDLAEKYRITERNLTAIN